MEEELKCPVCRRVYTKPVLLPCSHSLCVACALSLQEPAATHLPPTTQEDGTPLPSDQISLLDLPDMDKLSIVSETDSGVVCNSRPSSYVGTPSVASLFLQSLQSCSWAIRCVVCQRLVFLEDSGALSLPCNRALETIVDKYHHRKKVESKCDKCEAASSAESGDDATTNAATAVSGAAAAVATVMCVQCEVFYCDSCRDRHHPATGAKVKHNLVDPTQGLMMRSRKLLKDQKCSEHPTELLSKYCLSCRLPVCTKCAQDGRHMNHDAQPLALMAKSQKSELSQNLQSLSEKAKSGTEFIQRLKKMADSVSGNCAEFERTVVAQCDALMDEVRRRKEALLASVHEEREVKVGTLKGQVADCTALLHRTTGLLQYCIEVLKETDHSSFLQVSPGLINRVSMADINFNKEMELAPRVSPEFELTVDNTPCLHAVRSMNFFQMKDGIIAPGRPCIIPEECSCQNNSVTIAWAPYLGGVVEAYTLELDDGNGGDFRVVYVGRETICTVDGLHFNSIYNARVKAHNHAGGSEYSDIVSLQTAEVAWFTFDPAATPGDVVLSNGNVSATCSGFDHRVVLGSVGFSKGVHYWEVLVDRYDSHTDPSVGICRFDVDKAAMLGKDDKAWSMYIDDKRSWFLHRDEHAHRTDGGIRRGSVIGLLLDLNQHTLSYFLDEVPHGPIAFTDLHGVFFPAVSLNRNVQVTLRTGLEPPMESEPSESDEE
ncbi:E3 ubiquitin-protein ligase TRIM9-like [Babylonia areolata]|uniref:E3 ubiquitin-protein ligase TRIM9-like n=1 Tax=Babylonia areolata TaxID=304850 RepID=UPI003FD339BA